MRAGCISQLRAFWLFSDFGGANSMVAQMPREESKFEDNPYPNQAISDRKRDFTLR